MYALLSALLSISVSRAQGETIRFAVIGDYGYTGANEAAVAAMVAGFHHHRRRQQLRDGQRCDVRCHIPFVNNL